MNKNLISRKIITIIAVIIVFIMTAWGGVSFFLERKTLYSSINETANRTTERLSDSLVFPMWNLDDEQVDKILLSEMADRNFTAISVMDKSGLLHTSWIRIAEGKIIHAPEKALLRDAEKESFLGLKKEIFKGNENLGTIELYVTDYYLKQHFWNTVAKIGLQTMLIIGLLVPLLFIFFNKYIVQRIANIINGIEELKNRNYAVSIDIAGNDELSDIAININNMAKAIKEREQQLISLQQYLSNIVGSMPSMLISVNPGGVIKHWNANAAQSSGIDASEAIGKNLWELLPAFKNYWEHFERAIETNSHVYIPREALNIAGEKYFNISIFPLTASKGIVFMLNDITEIERKDEQVRHMQKANMLGTLAGGLA
ncbi:MAG: PAS domain-containing protein, partial [Deltaproteobacteria bacterium]|nr:PAS domain-containing protein [Deltaproteobacteria bacterium]